MIYIIIDTKKKKHFENIEFSLKMEFALQLSAEYMDAKSLAILACVDRESRRYRREQADFNVKQFIEAHSIDIMTANEQISSFFDDVNYYSCRYWEDNRYNLYQDFLKFQLKKYTESEWLDAVGYYLIVLGKLDYQFEFEKCCRRIRLLKRRKYPNPITNMYEVIQKTAQSVFWGKYEKLSQLRMYEMYGRTLIEALVHIDIDDKSRHTIRNTMIEQLINNLSRLQVFFAKPNQLTKACVDRLIGSHTDIRYFEGRFGKGHASNEYIASDSFARKIGLRVDTDIAHAYLCTFQLDYDTY